MTATLSPSTAATAFWSVANDDLSDGPCPISLERCTGWLLDLRRSTTDEVLLALVDDTIADLAQLGRIGRNMEDVVLGALASIEVAFEVRAAA